jgi:hypothetical protein
VVPFGLPLRCLAVSLRLTIGSRLAISSSLAIGSPAVAVMMVRLLHNHSRRWCWRRSLLTPGQGQRSSS